MISKVLANRYEILEKIGSGGMGNVYKAHDRRLDRIIAIKVLRLEYNEDNNFIRKFKRESLAAASISHPNIVSIYDVGSEEIDGNKIHYIVMEYIDGQTLKELINENGKIPENKALNYTIQIAEALKVAHQKHIVHRDIKSQNIMVTRDGRIKVTDFGIARVADNTTVTATNAVMGSVHYFSPEQARGSKVDNRSDIYSLGIVLYEMLTGTLPYDADNPVSVALMQVQSNMPRPSEKVKSLSSAVDMIVLKMTRKDPNKRYEDVSQLIKDLRSASINGNIFIDDFSSTDEKTSFIDTRALNENRSKKKKPIKKEVINKSPKKKKKSVAPAILGIFSAVVIIFLLAYIVPRAMENFNNRNAKQKIEVKDLVGKSKDEAKSILDAQKLTMNITNGEDPDKPNDEVLDQDPKPGEEVEEGSTITLVINQLPDTEKVPPLKNLTIDQAKTVLEELGLSRGEVEEVYNDEVDEGKIISSNPSEGIEVGKGTAVKLIVSKGVDDTPITLQNYTGVNQEDAKKDLEDKGLVVKIEEGPSEKVGESQVYNMDPKQGSKVKKGDTVTLYVVNNSISEELNTDDNNDSNSNKNDTNKLDFNKVTKVSVRIPDDGENHNVIAKRVKTYDGKKTDKEVWNFNREPGSVDDVELVGPGTYEIYVDGTIVKTEVVE